MPSSTFYIPIDAHTHHQRIVLIELCWSAWGQWIYLLWSARKFDSLNKRQPNSHSQVGLPPAALMIKSILSSVKPSVNRALREIIVTITILLLSLCVLSIGLISSSCNFPFEDLTDAEDSLVSDTEDNIGIHMPATST